MKSGFPGEPPGFELPQAVADWNSEPLGIREEARAGLTEISSPASLDVITAGRLQHNHRRQIVLVLQITGSGSPVNTRSRIRDLVSTETTACVSMLRCRPERDAIWLIVPSF